MANNDEKKGDHGVTKETIRKQSNGRRKIPIETITDQTKKHVTFSKRRVGLFKKASELCALCGVEMAILTFSERGKLFCFGHPNPDVVVHRFLQHGNQNHGQCSEQDEDDHHNTNDELTLMVEQHNRGFEEIKRKIQEEKTVSGFRALVEKSTKIAARQTKEEHSSFHWWDETPINDMGLDELEQFMSCLVELRSNVARKAGELTGTPSLLVPNQLGNLNMIVNQMNNVNNYNSKCSNLDFSPWGFLGHTFNSKFSENNALSYSSPKDKLIHDSSSAATMGSNFGFMNDVRPTNYKDMLLEDDIRYFPNQGMDFINYASINHHQAPVMDESSSNLTNHQEFVQDFKFGTSNF